MTRTRATLGTYLAWYFWSTIVGGMSCPIAEAGSPQSFIAHEWGTFSTFSGSDGAFLKFYPDDRNLPRFVYSGKHLVKGGIPDVLVSLETPVLYFYSDRERIASVRVEFPHGKITEWYPQASRRPFEDIVWEKLRILPRGRMAPLKSGEASRYFAARETDASPVQVAAESTETEKFLFYRGVGDLMMPLSVRAQGKGHFEVSNSGKAEIGSFVFVQVHGGKVRFQTFQHLLGGARMTVQDSSADSDSKVLRDILVKTLMLEGLYAKEACAMIKTWESSWFEEEGTRVLYLIPNSEVERFLPLRVEPKPESLIRVLVGRHDFLCPEREQEIDLLVNKMRGSSTDEARIAEKALDTLGRYRAPAISSALARLKAQKTASRKHE